MTTHKNAETFPAEIILFAEVPDIQVVTTKRQRIPKLYILKNWTDRNDPLFSSITVWTYLL